MNRDTLYSAGVFDLDASPLTVIKPNANGRFLSMLVVNQDHSMQPVIHAAGTFEYSRKKIGSRYVFIIFRTFVDANDPNDIQAANSLQSEIISRQ